MKHYQFFECDVVLFITKHIIITTNVTIFKYYWWKIKQLNFHEIW